MCSYVETDSDNAFHTGQDEDSAGEAKPNICLLSDVETGAYHTPATLVRVSYLFHQKIDS